MLSSDHPTASALVVDDDFSIRRILRYMLERRDFLVDEAADAAEAAALARSRKPDVIFLDISLFQSDAIDVIRRLSLAGFPGVIHLVSGREPDLLAAVGRIVREHGLRLGAMIPKPFRRAEIDAALDRDWSANAAPGETEEARPIAMAEALRCGWVAFDYQPKIALRRAEIVGAECLARIRRPGFAEAHPPAFMDAMTREESRGLAHAAFQAAVAAWETVGRHDLRFSINVRLSDLEDPSFVAMVRDVTPSDPAWPGVLIEVADGDTVIEPELLYEVATQLRIHGTRLALDGFGLKGLQDTKWGRLHFSEIKIKGEIVRGAAEDPDRQATMRMAVGIASAASADVVAKGIETVEDCRTAVAVGCDFGQGLYFAAPCGLPRLVELIRDEADWLPRLLNAAPPPLVRFEGLTAREHEVLAMVAEGLASKEIGRRLGISHRTVEGARARIMAKLGARTTAELVGLYFKGARRD